MRGSPLLRTIFILLGLAVSAFALVKLTTEKKPQPIAPQIIEKTAANVALPYHLLLSAEASEIQISGSDSAVSKQLSGNVIVDPTNPFVSLTVRWKNPPAPGEQRFAKLTLDPPGKSTITHVFDSSGDIDDLLELPR